DLLQISRNISDRLIEDPVSKHGYSLQADLEISGSYFDLYLPAIQDCVEDAAPDIQEQRNFYKVVGADWEKQHFLSTWALSERSRRNIYRGPQWLEDNFEIPLPPKHEFRMYLKDNRPEGDFRIRIIARNEPPTEGGDAEPQELTVFLDEGFMRPYKPVGTITVEAKEGPQAFELFGNVRDWIGVNPEPIGTEPTRNKKEERARSSSYRILSVQNNNVLEGFEPPVNVGETDRSGGVYLVRPDDQWIEAFGEQPGLQPSYRGPAGAHPGGKGKTPAIYREVMKSRGHAVIERIEFELPYTGGWPPPSIERFLTNGALEPRQLPGKLQEFAALAWRRPLDEEMSSYVSEIFAGELAVGSSPLAAMRDSIAVILSDPKFLYLTRTGATPRERNFELVSRLAFFLWDGPPDLALMRLASRDEPLDNATLLAEVDRLLADPRSERFVESFVSIWVGFLNFEQIAIDPNYYPDWRPSLKLHLKGECVAFFNELLRNDLSSLNLLDSDFIVVNQRVAEHYGIPGVNGLNFSRVPAPEGRGGILTQAAVLLAYSNGQDAHAVNRGVWVRSRLLGDPPSEPPPDVPALADQDAEKVDDLSIKERLQIHAAGTCFDCHKDIDPWGVAMEGFDATGMPRERILRIAEERKRRQQLPVVKEVEIDGQAIGGMAELRAYLREQRSEEFATGFTQHLLSYAIGREPTYRDAEQVAALQEKFREGDYTMRSLIKAIVTSPLFRD
ncbi:MAG: DUF1592 domain-containing protein, partial [Verrucomicrobiota bacterium]